MRIVFISKILYDRILCIRMFFLVVIRLLALIRWHFSYTVCIFDLRKTFLLAILYREHFIVQNLLVWLFVPYHNFSRKLFVFGFGESFQCVFFKLICLSLVDPTQPKPADSVVYSFISCFSAIYLFSFEFIYIYIVFVGCFDIKYVLIGMNVKWCSSEAHQWRVSFVNYGDDDE